MYARNRPLKKVLFSEVLHVSKTTPFLKFFISPPKHLLFKKKNVFFSTQSHMLFLKKCFIFYTIPYVIKRDQLTCIFFWLLIIHLLKIAVIWHTLVCCCGINSVPGLFKSVFQFVTNTIIKRWTLSDKD